MIKKQQIDNLINHYKNQDSIISLISPDFLSIRYHQDIGGFLLRDHHRGKFLTAREFMALANAIVSDYTPDETVEVLNTPTATRAPVQQCNRPKKPEQKAGYVYLLGGYGYYKIGMSVDVDNRIKQISPALPFEVEITHIIKTDDMERLELELHEKFTDKRANGEWFSLDPDDVAYIMSLPSTKDKNDG